MNWGIAIPILAVILTIIAVLLLWYWWSSSREPGAAGPTATPPDQPAPGWMRWISFEMGLINKLRDWVKSTLAGLIPARISASGSRTVPARQTGELVEAIRLFRDLATGGLVVEIGGRRYFALSEITDDTIRRRFMGVAESVAQFAEGIASAPSAYLPPPVVTTPIVAASTPVTAASPEITGKGKKEEKIVIKSVAEEIEELLQYRLTISPDFLQRSIHIRESHGGAILVEVDGHFYDGVSEVADEPVKAFLQDIVREWEARK